MKLAILLASALLLPFPAHALAPVVAGCAPTAEAAVTRLLTHAAATTGDAEGFRVVSVRRDPLRKSAWALVASCVDPSRPMQALPIAADVQAPPSPTAVRIGDRVTVVGEDGDSRMQLTAFSRDTGGVNQIVRVEMPRLSADYEQAAPVIRCKVVGPGIVEVVQ
jgi:hypothetical protein